MEYLRLTERDPSRIGNYDLAARIGAGGMGVVYLAYDIKHEPLALKLPHLGQLTTPASLSRFRREIQALRAVQSENVARILAADMAGESPWIAMEFIPGRSLDRHLSEVGVLRSEDILTFARGLLLGIGAIHRRSLVHRDIKPSNVMLAARGPVVIDFGIAKGMDATNLTLTGNFVGTPRWLAPEQLRGRPAGSASDVFAWANCVYAAATGVSIWTVIDSGSSDVSASDRNLALSSLPAAVAVLVPALFAALESEPDARPSTQDLLALISSANYTPDHRSAINDADPKTWSFPQPSMCLPVVPVVVPEVAPRQKMWAGFWPTAAVVACVAAASVFMMVAHPLADEPMSNVGSISGAQGADQSAEAVVVAADPLAAWPTNGSDLMNAAEVGDPPPFPTEVPNYVLTRTHRVTTRVFGAGTQLKQSAITDFPVTMNSCGMRQMFVRWRTMDDSLPVRSVVGSSPDFIELDEAGPSTMGYMRTSGCGQPLFELLPQSINWGDGGNQTDVIVEYQVWEPTVS